MIVRTYSATTELAMPIAGSSDPLMDIDDGGPPKDHV